MSQANTYANTAQVSGTDAVPSQAQFRQAAGHLTAGPPSANIGFTNTASPPAEQQASPSLAGMTAAEVAQALGLNALEQPHGQHGKNNANPLPSQPPVRKQANGRKKRGRDIEVAGISSGASQQHTGSTVAADVTSRAGSPGVSSSTDLTPPQVQQEPDSSVGTADEEQKRMVCQHLGMQISLIRHFCCRFGPRMDVIVM